MVIKTDAFPFYVAIFDLDLTLWNGVSLYKDVMKILNTLKEHDIKLYVASFHLEAHLCCQQLSIDSYFEEIHYGRDRTKADMVQAVLNKHPNIDAENVVFFDDNFHNIINVKNVTNVQTIYINKEGLTWYDIPRYYKPEKDVEKYNYNTKYEVFDYYLE